VAIGLRTSVTPFQRGFFCDDLSIKYPVVKAQTVKTSVLLAVAFSLAAVLFAVAEYLNNKRDDGQSKRYDLTGVSRSSPAGDKKFLTRDTKEEQK